MKVKVKKLVPEAVLPEYKHVDKYGNPNDMGMDIVCTSYEYDALYDRYIYHTGLAFKIPQGYGMLIFPRSSNTKTNAYLPNSVGILDSNYTGELIFCYKNRTADWQVLTEAKEPDLKNLELTNEFSPYQVGDKIGQIVILPYPFIEWNEVNELPITDRGADGGINRADKNFKK